MLRWKSAERAHSLAGAVKSLFAALLFVVDALSFLVFAASALLIPRPEARPRGPIAGSYLAVLREGDVGAGDPLELVAEDDGHITVADVVGLYEADPANQDLLRRASELTSLPESWRDYFRERLGKPDA